MQKQKINRRIPEEQEEMDNYQEIIGYYNAHKILKRKYWDLYDLVSKNILKNIKLERGNVLDVACGYGGLMKGLNKYRKKLYLTGIDSSKNMIRVGKKYILNNKINFHIMNADKLNFKDETFDFVLCKDSFHHFNNPVKVIKEMYRVLKKGGYIYSIDLRRDAPQKVIWQIVQSASELNIKNAILYLESNRASYTLNEIDKLIKKAKIKDYRLFTPKIGANFVKEYGLKKNNYLSASNYLRDKWVFIIKKNK